MTSPKHAHSCPHCQKPFALPDLLGHLEHRHANCDDCREALRLFDTLYKRRKTADAGAPLPDTSAPAGAASVPESEVRGRRAPTSADAGAAF